MLEGDTNQENQPKKPNIVSDLPLPKSEGGMKVCTYKHFYQDTSSVKLMVPSSEHGHVHQQE